MMRIWRLWNQVAWGLGQLLTQWIAKYGYVPIVLIGMAGLAYDIGTREWTSGNTIVAKTPVVAEAPVERGPLALENKAEPKLRMQLAALDPQAGLLDDPGQPASKGYVLYANSPTNWTPVPLPEEPAMGPVPLEPVMDPEPPPVPPLLELLALRQ